MLLGMRSALLSSVAFTPASLFASGAPGFLLDATLSDLSSLFQDSAGTIPVTAVEQPVGRVLDTSGRGNHFVQSTSAARPVLSARVNLLTKTEQFDDAVWAKFGATITANSTAAPDGTTTADALFETSANGNHYYNLSSPLTLSTTVAYTGKIYVKANGRTKGQFTVYNPAGTSPGGNGIFDLNTKTIAATAIGTGSTLISSSITELANNWFLVSMTVIAGSGSTIQFQLAAADDAGSVSYVGDPTKGLYVWGADLRVANDTASPVYQRVNTATDYATTGFPLYLRYDGTDDFHVSAATVNFSTTAQMSVFAGVRKLSDANTGMLVSLGTFSTGNTFELQAPTLSAPASNYVWVTHGNGANVTNDDFNAYRLEGVASPITNVLTATADRSIQNTNGVALRNNGAIATRTATAFTGTNVSGNFIDAATTIGRRSGAAGTFLNGRIYFPLVVLGRTATATEIANMEIYLSASMGGGYVPTGYDFLVTGDGDQLTDASGNPLYTQPLYL